MPLYEYECDACGQRFELIRKFSDPPVDACAVCGKGPVHRLLSSPAIQFKGTGWYITDYAQKGKGGKAEPAGGEKSADGKSDSQPPAEAAKAGTEGTAKTDSAKDGAAAPAGAPASTAAKSKD